MNLGDPIGAFVANGQFVVEGEPAGALRGMKFAVKDLIDVAGHRTGAGNPTWLRTHPEAAKSASCVTRLLAAGATLIGKTHTDELAYSMNGDNFHYGTPVNVSAAGRTPGGSSSGSAAAVAAQLCDFALATDTGGSTRIPSSFCGLFGLRTTFGAIPADGLVALMPSFDTVTWLAKKVVVFESVGDVLLPEAGQHPIQRVILLEDAFAQAEEGISEALSPGIDWISKQFGGIRKVIVSEDLDLWRRAYITVSAREAWAVHGAWIQAHSPAFGPAVGARFAYAKAVTDEAVAEAEGVRTRICARMEELLPPGTVALLPSTPGPALPLDAGEAEIDRFRQRAMRVNCIAGMAGLPQVNVPGFMFKRLPIGLSLMGPKGSDVQLIRLAAAMTRAISHQGT
jgi:amidase